MKHTPGPWHADRLIPEDSVYLRTVRAGHDHIAHVLDLDGASDEARANAHLIAAAPDMLAALGAFVARAESESCMTMHSVWFSDQLRQASAAIAKAGGAA